MDFSRQECWSGLPFPSPGDLPDPGIEPRSPALPADSLPSEPPGKPLPLSGWQLFPGMLMSYCFQSTSSKDHENILRWGYRYLQTANNGTNQNAECQEPTSRAPTVCSGEVIKNMDFNHTDLVESCFCHLSVKLSKLANLSLNFFFWLCKAKTVRSLTGWVSSSWGWPICGQLLANCSKKLFFL